MKSFKSTLILIWGVSCFFACDPVEETYNLGGIISTEEVSTKISVTNEKPGNNKIILSNSLDGVAGIWDYGIGTSSKKNLEVILPPGEYQVKFTALCDGGVVTVSKPIVVTKIEYELSEEWTNLCGKPDDGGKTWLWATDNPNMGYNGTSTFFGNGGEFASAPEWWKGDAKELGEAGLYDEMVFTYNSVTFVDKSDESTTVSTTPGSFILDTKTKDVSGKKIEGYLELPFYVMNKELDAPSKFANPYKYEIVKLTGDELTLRIRGADGGWSIICILKRKGFSY